LDRGAYRLERVLKHDSWAATALYASSDGSKVVCKFARTNPILGIVPFSPIGRITAERERRVFRAMQDVAGFPRWAGPVRAHGEEVKTAVSHYWIEGLTFRPSLEVNDDFFPTLNLMLRSLHGRNMAHMDMAKWENILVGNDGHPYLLDYQLCFHARHGWPGSWILRTLQKFDSYYLQRHWSRCRSDQRDPSSLLIPLPVAIGEFLGRIWRPLRIATLHLFGVRHDPRKEESAARDGPTANSA
jgi:hypothetical protein